MSSRRGRAERTYANSYVAGVALGLVLLSAFMIMGRGLGASGAFAEAAFRFDAGNAVRCLQVASTRGFTIDRSAACMRATDETVAVGAVRASLGMANNEADVRRAIDLTASFVDGAWSPAD